MVNVSLINIPCLFLIWVNDTASMPLVYVTYSLAGQHLWHIIYTLMKVGYGRLNLFWWINWYWSHKNTIKYVSQVNSI